MSYIRLNDVSIDFKGRNLLSNISFSIEKGEVCRITGQNGSGKSTLLKLITGLIRPSRGEIMIDGNRLPWGQYMRDVGIIINKPVFIGSLTGVDNLKLLASIQNKISDKAIADWMHRFGLDPSDKTPVRKYSVGMNQKLAIIQALMEEPGTLVLDEPLNGLDRTSKNFVIDTLQDLSLIHI